MYSPLRADLGGMMMEVCYSCCLVKIECIGEHVDINVAVMLLGTRWLEEEIRAAWQGMTYVLLSSY